MKPPKRLFLSESKLAVVQRFLAGEAKVALTKDFQLPVPVPDQEADRPVLNKGAVAPNLLNRNFEVDPNPEVDRDVTKFSVGDRKLYLSPVMDICGRQINSCAIGTSPTMALTSTSLRKALTTLKDSEKTRLGSDRGLQYQHPHDRLPSVPIPEPRGCRVRDGQWSIGAPAAGSMVMLPQPRMRSSLAPEWLPGMTSRRPISGLKRGSETRIATAKAPGRFRDLGRAFASMSQENYTPTTRSDSHTPAKIDARQRLRIWQAREYDFRSLLGVRSPVERECESMARRLLGSG
jgi:hypothetical protein